MKLELKHLAPYLPYGLKFIKNDKTYYGEAHRSETGKLAYENSRKGEMVGIKKNLNKIITRAGSFTIGSQSIIIKKRFVDSHISFKLILRPLSDLTKEIEHNGEKFDPLSTLLLLYGKVVFPKQVQKEKELIYEHLKTANYKWLPYKIISFLFQHHFDVFGLIDEGLAIDINTL